MMEDGVDYVCIQRGMTGTINVFGGFLMGGNNLCAAVFSIGKLPKINEVYGDPSQPAVPSEPNSDRVSSIFLGLILVVPSMMP